MLQLPHLSLTTSRCYRFHSIVGLRLPGDQLPIARVLMLSLFIREFWSFLFPLRVSMALTPAPPNKDEEVNNPPTSASCYQKTVCLQDWWLIKAEKDFQGRSIAVAGTTSRENRKFAVRMFSSAPILKTYDLHILETVDGVSVILKGFINKERTKENGFSSEVFKHFVFGFPPNWERCAEGAFVGGSSIKHTSKMVEGSSVDDSTDSSLASDKLSTDTGNVDDLYEATSNRNESTSNSGAYGNNDEMDQGLENVATRQTPIEGLPTTPLVTHMDDLHETAQDRTECTSNSGGCANFDQMDHSLENFAARQTQTESSPSTPIVARTKIRQVLEEVIGSTMKSPKLPSISEAGSGSNARRSKRQKTTGSQILHIHEKIVKASSRCLNHKNTDISPKRDSEILNGEKRNGSVAAITATPVMRKDNLQEPSISEGRMDVFSFVKSGAGGKSKVKYVSRTSPYQLRRVVYGDAKSGRVSNFTQPEVGVANAVADKTQEQKSGNKASQASKPSKRTRQTRESSIGVSDVSQKKNQNVADKETTANDSGRSKKKTKRELIYESPLVQEKEVTESLSFKRSRSGRLLVPTLEFWRNQRVVYDGDHKVIAFVEGLDCERTSSKVTRSEPRRKRGRL